MEPFLAGMLPENIFLKFLKPVESFYVVADSVQMEQVILNIVKNAAESIKGAGEIRIKLDHKKSGLLLEISNNGEPIPEETSRQLFTPFFTTKPDGKGIGLTFVREVLNRHKADYSLKTDSDGITRFSIMFKK